MADEDDTRDGGMVDAAQFMRFSDGLKQSFERLGEASVTDAARQRWQRRLLAITTTAQRDLDRAEKQFARFRTDFDREFGPAPVHAEPEA